MMNQVTPLPSVANPPSASLQGRAFDERMWPAAHAIRELGDRLSQEGSVTLISGALADRPE